MALLDFEKKDGLQYGTVGDECYYCRRNRNPEDEYEPKSLDRQLVYKIKIYGNEYCLCEDCFKKTLGDFILLNPKDCEKCIVNEEVKVEDEEVKVEEKKVPAKKNSKKKEGEE